MDCAVLGDSETLMAAIDVDWYPPPHPERTQIEVNITSAEQRVRFIGTSSHE